MPLRWHAGPHGAMTNAHADPTLRSDRITRGRLVRGWREDVLSRGVRLIVLLPAAVLVEVQGGSDDR